VELNLPDFYEQYNALIILSVIRILWVYIAFRVLIYGVLLRRDWVKADRARALRAPDEVQRLVAKAWIAVTSIVIQQALGLLFVGLLSFITPAPVRPEITLYFLLSAGGFLWFEYSIYRMVRTMDRLNYAIEKWNRDHPNYLQYDG
jgi:hypothetical protein